jgi:hypothetical protein
MVTGIICASSNDHYFGTMIEKKAGTMLQFNPVAF